MTRRDNLRGPHHDPGMDDRQQKEATLEGIVDRVLFAIRWRLPDKAAVDRLLARWEELRGTGNETTGRSKKRRAVALAVGAVVSAAACLMLATSLAHRPDREARPHTGLDKQSIPDGITLQPGAESSTESSLSDAIVTTDSGIPTATGRVVTPGLSIASLETSRAATVADRYLVLLERARRHRDGVGHTINNVAISAAQSGTDRRTFEASAHEAPQEAPAKTVSSRMLKAYVRSRAIAHILSVAEAQPALGREISSLLARDAEVSLLVRWLNEYGDHPAATVLVAALLQQDSLYGLRAALAWLGGLHPVETKLAAIQWCEAPCLKGLLRLACSGLPKERKVATSVLIETARREEVAVRLLRLGQDQRTARITVACAAAAGQQKLVWLALRHNRRLAMLLGSTIPTQSPTRVTRLQ